MKPFNPAQREAQQARQAHEAPVAPNAPEPRAPEPDAHLRRAAPTPSLDPQLLEQLGRELAGPLTHALELATALTTHGRLAPGGLRALHETVARGRQVGIVCQQIARLVQGQARPTPEAVALDDTLRTLLAHRQAEAAGRMGPSEGLSASRGHGTMVDADPALLASLLQALLDACQDVTLGAVTLELSSGAWPVQAQLRCRFEPDPQRLPGMTLNWHLFDHLARCMNVSWVHAHQVHPGRPTRMDTLITLSFSADTQSQLNIA